MLPIKTTSICDGSQQLTEHGEYSLDVEIAETQVEKWWAEDGAAPEK